MLAPANGPFVGALDDTVLAQSIGQLLGDRALRHRIGAANRAKAEAEFDQAGMFRAYGALWRGA
jgi:hypothetical protein